MFTNSCPEIDVERSCEHFFSIQKVVQLVVISHDVFEIKPSNSENDTKIFYKENTQKITIHVSLLVLSLILILSLLK